MGRKILIFILLLAGFNNIINSQVIRGQLVSVSNNKLNVLPGIPVKVDSIFRISGPNGIFVFDSLKNYPYSIWIEAYRHLKLTIFKLPQNYDTLNLGKIELFEYPAVSHGSYDSLNTATRNYLKNLKVNDSLIIRNVDSVFKSAYRPVYVDGKISGYCLLNFKAPNEMLNPYHAGTKIEINHNYTSERIYLDFNKIKK